MSSMESHQQNPIPGKFLHRVKGPQRQRSTFSSILAVFLVWQVGVAVANSCAAESAWPFVTILGVAQDGGYPHAGCKRACCQAAWGHPDVARSVTCLGLVDPETGQRWLVECTPDFSRQLAQFDSLFPTDDKPGIAGILLTHAHIGHYSGLIQLGREVMGSRNVPVYAMPRMRNFLSENGPWSQLVGLSNIELRPLEHKQRTSLGKRLAVTPILVPHRDEFSETVGFVIHGPRRKVLFLPDINKWETWDTWNSHPLKIEQLIAQVDQAYVDGTFFANGEIPGRDMSEIPHPFIRESVTRFARLPAEERSKIGFIHLNHTNPALRTGTAARKEITAAGMRVVDEGDRFEL